MGLPELLKYNSEDEYFNHYEREYCRKVVITFDNIRVYFGKNKFHHAFYESSRRDGNKDTFSLIRARRMNWIRKTLEHQKSKIFQGWGNKKNRYDPSRRVCIVYGDFVVIIAMKLKKNGTPAANFITCYKANNSIGKIRKSPAWSKKGCINMLK